MLREVEEVLDRSGRAVGVQLDLDVAVVRVERDVRQIVAHIRPCAAQAGKSFGFGAAGRGVAGANPTGGGSAATVEP
ncbi:hypothetical protein GCM10009000_022880 [Halobacterium noricense]